MRKCYYVFCRYANRFLAFQMKHDKYIRFFDLIISITILLVATPVFIVLTLLLYLFQNGQVFFTQRRPGIRSNVIRVIKFKTMNDIYDKDGELLSDEMRLTKIGKFVRKSSLDELPQLINVICGDMSLVGPRPLLMEYLPLYSREQARRHEIRPGITGWAQVNGRNNLTWDNRFKLDVWYVENRSIYLYFKILVMTVFKVIKREGVSQEGHVTAQKFQGS